MVTDMISGPSTDVETACRYITPAASELTPIDSAATNGYKLEKRKLGHALSFVDIAI